MNEPSIARQYLEKMIYEARLYCQEKESIGMTEDNDYKVLSLALDSAEKYQKICENQLKIAKQYKDSDITKCVDRCDSFFSAIKSLQDNLNKIQDWYLKSNPESIF